METPIEVVRRFCAAWSDNMGAVDLAAFFTEDAVYHNIPQAPVTGREDSQWSGRDDGAGGRLQAPRQVVRAAGHGHLRGQRRQDQRLAGLFRYEPVHEPDGIRLDPLEGEAP